MHTYVVTLAPVNSIPFERLQTFRDRLEEENFGTPDWFTSSAMRWVVDAEDRSWEDELHSILNECEIPGWYISIGNGGNLQ